MFGLNRLFGNGTAQTQTSSKPRAKALDLELLEGRTMPATTNYLILDFTPDSHVGSFSDTFFNTKQSNGYAPAFLDFNHDGKITTADVTTAASQIASKVASFYAPFVNNASNHLSIQYGDVTSNSKWGTQWVNYGRAYSNVEVAVMYLGGTNKGGSSILGIAPTAPNGANIEGYGETYTRTAANYLMGSNPHATSADFVNVVAATAAHELGHMLGLQHSTSGDSQNVMSAVQSRTPGSTHFVYGNVNTVTGYQQNAYAELDASFQKNQQQIAGNITSGQFLHDDDDTGGTGDVYGFDSQGAGSDNCHTDTQSPNFVAPVTHPTHQHADTVHQLQDVGTRFLLGSGQTHDDGDFGLDRWSVALDR